MKTKGYFFIVIMTVLMTATSVRFYQIDRFKKSSEKFSVVVSEESFKKVKSGLEDITFQPVEEELLDDGSYRLTFRCPPEKLQNLWRLIDLRKYN